MLLRQSRAGYECKMLTCAATEIQHFPNSRFSADCELLEAAIIAAGLTGKRTEDSFERAKLVIHGLDQTGGHNGTVLRAGTPPNGAAAPGPADQKGQRPSRRVVFPAAGRTANRSVGLRDGS
ncbi:hypothetical protein [Methylobacterium oryzisoli]|uniref:hypothetical protein n=1 Tax=Methylobacterium oryzisoli TaxID=3385502 RepID=UPI0038929AE5